jgi:signal transduction histidine kinase
MTVTSQARSLRVRVLLLAALSIAMALGVAGFSLAIIFERHLAQRLEQELGIKLFELARTFSVDESGTPGVGAVLSDPRYDAPYGGAYWQVMDAGGSPVLRSRSLWDDVIPSGESGGVAAEAAIERDGPGGSTLYVLERDVQREDGGEKRSYRLQVAVDHAELEGLRRSFAIDMAVALLGLGALLLVGAWMQAGIGLRPLRALRERLNAVHGGSAPRLVGEFPDEVAPLVSDLNRLLDRQQDLVSKARKRAGDLAHGLKTPLTIMSAEARRLDETGMHAAAETLREQVALMRAHIERELARARTHGTPTAAGLHTDVAGTIERLLRLMQRMPRGEDLTWHNAVPPGARCAMDADDFGEVLGNLLDNARKWAISRIEIRAESAAEGLAIVVADDGPGLADGASELLLKRGERAREDREGSGLGLSIVSDILTAYGSVLTLDRGATGGCEARFVVPGSITARPPPDDTPRRRLARTAGAERTGR